MDRVKITPSLSCPMCGANSLATYDIVETLAEGRLMLDMADEMTGLTIYCKHCKAAYEVESIIVNYRGRGSGSTTYS